MAHGGCQPGGSQPDCRPGGCQPGGGKPQPQAKAREWPLQCGLCARETRIYTWKLPMHWRWVWDEKTSEWQAVCKACIWRHWRDARKECPLEDWHPALGRYVDKVLEEYDESLHREMDRRALPAHGLPAPVFTA